MVQNMAAPSSHGDTPTPTWHFACPCGNRFVAVAEHETPFPARPHHPVQLSAVCNSCGQLAPQAHWEINLLKAHLNATGPTSPEGKAVVARNLAGHPTPEEARNTRFNALKTGAYAETATFFPARPGKYPQCEGCRYEPQCQAGNLKWCLSKAELFLKHQVAFETGDPGLLTSLRATQHAAIAGLIEDMLITIARDGTRLVKPVHWFGKDGDVRFAEYTDDKGHPRRIEEISAHPLLRPLTDLLAKMGMTLSDLGMTPKIREDANQVDGQLATSTADREQLLEFASRQTLALERLPGLIKESRSAEGQDAVLRQLAGADADGE